MLQLTYFYPWGIVGYLRTTFPSPIFAASLWAVSGSLASSGLSTLINHLSWHHNSSVNDGVPDDEGHILYDRLESAIEDLTRLGLGTSFAQLDLMNALRHIPVQAADWHLLSFHWGAKFYSSLALAVGLKTAPYSFNPFSGALH